MPSPSNRNAAACANCNARWRALTPMLLGLTGSMSMLIGVMVGPFNPWWRVVAYAVGCALFLGMAWVSWALRKVNQPH